MYHPLNAVADDNKNHQIGLGEHVSIGRVKIRVLGYNPEFFSLWPHAALWGLAFHILQWK